MSKVRLLMAAVLTASILGAGAAVAAPSASAAPRNCDAIHDKAMLYGNVADLLYATGYYNTRTFAAVWAKHQASLEAWGLCMNVR